MTLSDPTPRVPRPDYSSEGSEFFYKVEGKSKQGPYSSLREAQKAYEDSLKPKAAKQGKESARGSQSKASNKASESEGTSSDSGSSKS